MGDPRGFVKYRRVDPPKRPIPLRVLDWREVESAPDPGIAREQGARCMDCGVPFCQADTGCPVNNLIPEWNDLVHHDRWEEALASLHATNNFPEFTGRVCPAPCESACVLGIIDDPVSIKGVEQAVADRGFEEGWVTPRPPARETGKRVAVVGSGPAGLAAAQQLRRAGHSVVVYEKDDRPGGLLRYGIPDFKLEKSVVDRRLRQMEAEGVEFRTGLAVGRDLDVEELRREHDALVLATGAQRGRDLEVPGRELRGIHPAMEYLAQQNRRVAGDRIDPAESISAEGKRVVVIGGGDTGADCLGTAHRQRAAAVHQLSLYPEPPRERSPLTPWPLWPMQLRLSSAHEEGGRVEWSVVTRGFSGEDGHVRRLHGVRAEVTRDAEGRRHTTEIPGTEFELDVDLVLLAIGFVGPEDGGALEGLGVERDARGCVRADARYRTSVEGVFVAGDAYRGASLVVWAIRDGREAARAVDRYLLGGAAAWR